jgi:glycosyltransferase involved in cell wall biosynthesis
MKRPKLSIVIPTKNRYCYLKILIESFVKNKNQEFEVIIQDNSDQNQELVEFLNQINDDRIIYRYHKEWLSAVENCDKGIEAASGDYICMIGDDDGILIDPSIYLIEYLQKNNFEAAIVNLINYAWEDTVHAVWGNKVSGKLQYDNFTHTYKVLDSDSELKKILQQSGCKGLGNLPRVYQGFVKKSKLEELRFETGTYFPGPSPDMANSTGLTKYVTSYVYADYPSVISGHSKKSTAGQGNRKEHFGSIEDQPHLPKDTSKNWSKDIPYFWSAATIYAESLAKALVKTDRVGLKYNLNYLYAFCFIYESNYKKYILDFIKSQLRSNGENVNQFKIIFYVIVLIFLRGINFIKNIFHYNIGSINQKKFSTISNVIEYLNAELLKDGPPSIKE